MCLTQPATVLSVRPDELVVDVAGRVQTVSRVLVPDARVGDQVLVGLGRALNVLTADEASRLHELLAPVTPIPERA